jgi:hypothetical protein
MTWEYVGISRRIGRTPVPVGRIALDSTFCGERSFHFRALPLSNLSRA